MDKQEIYPITFMDMLTWVLLFSISILLLLWFRIYYNKSAPPGPFPLPFIGTLYAHSIAPSGEKCSQLAKKYGGVYSLFVGPKHLIFVNDVDLISKVLKHSSFVNRGITNSNTLKHLGYPPGIFRADYNKKLVEDRKLVSNTFRLTGVGKPAMDRRIQFETNAVITHFLKQSRSFNPSRILHMAMLNFTLGFAFDTRLDYDDEDAKTFIDVLYEINETYLYNNVIDNIGMLCNIPPFSWHMKWYFNSNRVLIDILDKYLTKYLERFSPSNTSCFVDIWLQSHQESKQQTAGFDRKDLIGIILDLIGAGTDSTATAILWFIVYITNRPHLQERLYNEIQDNIGIERQVNISDKQSLPLLQATILETYRLGSVAPFSVRQSDPTCDIKLANYTIKKGTHIIVNLYHAHMDETLWENPHEFNPGRFLNEDGTKVIRNARVIPFGGGKRMCIGDVLAKHEIFLLTSNFIQQCRFSIPVGTDKISEEPQYAKFRGPKPFSVVVNAR